MQFVEGLQRQPAGTRTGKQPASLGGRRGLGSNNEAGQLQVMSICLKSQFQTGHCGENLIAYVNQVSRVTGWVMATENLSFVSLGYFPVTKAEMACNQR